MTMPETATLPEQSAVEAPATPESTATQETETNPQGQNPPQSPGEGQVEPSAPAAPSNPSARVRPSDYVRQRQEMRNLKSTIANMERTIQTLQSERTAPAKPEPQKPDYSKKVWDDPVSVMTELIDNAIRDSVPKLLNETQSVTESKARKQEALEMIFTNDHVSKDGEDGYKRIAEILRDTGLDVVAQSDPKKAAKTALEIYKLKYPRVIQAPRAPLAPQVKGQMSTTQTGLSAAPKKEVSVTDLQAQLRQIRDSIIANPETAGDPATTAKIAEIKKKLAEQTQ